MAKVLTFTFFLFFCISCKRDNNCKLNHDILKFNDSVLLKATKEKPYLDFLTKMKEPKLEFLNEEVYRFVIMEAFGNIQVYRLNKEGSRYIIRLKKYVEYVSDTINYNEMKIDSLSNEVKKPISENDWNAIKNKLNEMNFWNLPVLGEKHLYVDGAPYFIEAYNPIKNICTNRNYHAVQRTSPNDSTKFKSIFKKIIDLAK
jgi:hypothetical protein